MCVILKSLIDDAVKYIILLEPRKRKLVDSLFCRTTKINQKQSKVVNVMYDTRLWDD